MTGGIDADCTCGGTGISTGALGCTLEIVKHWWTGVRWVWVGPGQEPPTIPSGFHVLPRRWVVEVCHSWLNRFRKLLVRFEKKLETHLALLQFACAYIVLKRARVIR